nr:MAG TPA: hypothetical protein [Caudoviricetes sp.]
MNSDSEARPRRSHTAGGRGFSCICGDHEGFNAIQRLETV